jgi:hypothetical protein
MTWLPLGWLEDHEDTRRIGQLKQKLATKSRQAGKQMASRSRDDEISNYLVAHWIR